MGPGAQRAARCNGCGCAVRFAMRRPRPVGQGSEGIMAHVELVGEARTVFVIIRSRNWSNEVATSEGGISREAWRNSSQSHQQRSSRTSRTTKPLLILPITHTATHGVESVLGLSSN